MSDAVQSLLVKMILSAAVAWATKNGVAIDGSTLQMFVASGVACVAAGVGIYQHWGMKKVPVDSIAVRVAGEDNAALAKNGSNTRIAVSTIGSDNAVTAKIVGALLLGFFLFHGAPAFAQPKTPDANGNAANSCDPTILFKSLAFKNFIAAIKTCSGDDVQAAIGLANAQVPPDNATLACLMPVQGIIANTQQGGIFVALQTFRNAKRAGLLLNCTAWVNSTLVP